MQRTTNATRAALLLSLLFTAGCSLRHARESAIRIAANVLRQSVFCLQGSVPLTQSTFKPSPVATNAAVTPRAAQPVPFERFPNQPGDPRLEGSPDAGVQTVTCPIERQRLLSLGLLRTL